MLTSSTNHLPVSPVAAAVALGPTIEGAAKDTEQRRRISHELLASLRNAGLFRMGLPHEVGGSATDLPTMLATYEEVARHDGSTGWVTLIGSGNNLILTALPPETVKKVFTPDPNIATGGTWLPRGQATVVEGGYRVSGRWPFNSGCEHCDWLIGGCTVYHDGELMLNDEGQPTVRIMLYPRAEATIHDTWKVAGLRGTGSHDCEVNDLFVPAEHSFQLGVDLPEFSFPHARMPLFGMLAATMASVFLGIARGAIDIFVNYARTQRVGEGLVKDQPLIQAQVAEAEGLVRAARAFVFGTVELVWAKAVAGEDIPKTDDVLLRLAASHAARVCVEAVYLMYTAGGTAALYENNPLQRFHRDILAAQQHGMVAFHSYVGLGKALLDGGPKGA